VKEADAQGYALRWSGCARLGLRSPWFRRQRPRAAAAVAGSPTPVVSARPWSRKSPGPWSKACRSRPRAGVAKKLSAASTRPALAIDLALGGKGAVMPMLTPNPICAPSYACGGASLADPRDAAERAAERLPLEDLPPFTVASGYHPLGANRSWASVAPAEGGRARRSPCGRDGSHAP